jgi:hypothetical protein
MPLNAAASYAIVNRATGTVLTFLGNDPADNQGTPTLFPLACSTTLTSFHLSVVFSSAWHNQNIQQVRRFRPLAHRADGLCLRSGPSNRASMALTSSRSSLPVQIWPVVPATLGLCRVRVSPLLATGAAFWSYRVSSGSSSSSR